MENSSIKNYNNNDNVSTGAKCGGYALQGHVIMSGCREHSKAFFNRAKNWGMFSSRPNAFPSRLGPCQFPLKLFTVERLATLCI